MNTFGKMTEQQFLTLLLYAYMKGEESEKLEAMDLIYEIKQQLESIYMEQPPKQSNETEAIHLF